jgi:hypothetical protein
VFAVISESWVAVVTVFSPVALTLHRFHVWMYRCWPNCTTNPAADATGSFLHLARQLDSRAQGPPGAIKIGCGKRRLCVAILARGHRPCQAPATLLREGLLLREKEL